MTDTIQVRGYTRKKSSSAQAFEALRRERLDQLRKETESRKEQVPVIDAVQADEPQSPRRLKFSLIFMPWHWRLG